MARRKKGRALDGVVLLDKAHGVSSNHALQRVRRLLDARKAGHTGSLDPLATGLLPICLGEATKLSSYLLTADKRYRVTAVIGAETTTGDLEGEFTETSDVPVPADDELDAVLARFTGLQTQVPPMYSALKVAGRPLYAYARAGETVEREPRPITVHNVVRVAHENDQLTLDVSVSGGTYVRTLVEDIARAWGGRAHVSALRRTGVGTLGTDLPMVTQGRIEAETAATPEAAFDWLLPVSLLTQGWPGVVLDAEQARRLGQGQKLSPPDGVTWPAGDVLRVEDEAHRMLGLARVSDSGALTALRLFARPVS